MFEVRAPATKREYDAMYDLRWRILRKPWKQPRGSERDGLDGTNKVWNVIAIEKSALKGVEDKVIGTARLHKNSGLECQIRFMCVDGKYRNFGAGKRMLDFLHQTAARMGMKKIVADVRENARQFYLMHGYAVTGKSRTLFGEIPHVRMEKNLGEEKWKRGG